MSGNLKMRRKDYLCNVYLSINKRAILPEMALLLDIFVSCGLFVAQADFK